jgi:hypothetical protein
MNREQIIEDTTLVTKSVQRLKVQTPLGSIESDSGNHWIDIFTIVGVILVLYVGKKLIDKFFRGEK